MLTLTEQAISAVQRFIKSSSEPVSGLRVTISGGGCSGFQYGMRLEDGPASDDAVIDCNGLSVYVDPLSAPLLEGVTVDFVDSLDGSGFKFENPNAQSSCACGSSFSA
jgi:iron-sulfur cluster assembly protein